LQSKTFNAIKEKTPLTLQCEASGEPTALVRWMKGNKTLSYNNATSVLSIPAVTRSDTGNYTCIASNIAGSINHTVFVQVQCKLFFCLI